MPANEVVITSDYFTQQGEAQQAGGWGEGLLSNRLVFQYKTTI